MNTRHIAELIERGELNGVKEAMEQSLAPGSQTFEQDLFNLFHSKTITLDEALANADSPTNLHWLINNAQLASTDTQPQSGQGTPIIDFERTQPDGTSFREFTLHMDD
jgi:twitching motility protein PilU